MLEEMSVTTRSAVETFTLGEKLGSLLQPGHILLLSGNLGAGKTTFSKGVAAGAGVAEEVTSPTYTLSAEYEGRVRLVHMDLYRLGEASVEAGEPGAQRPSAELQDALADIGLEDYLEGDCALMIEWPQGLEAIVEDALTIRIQQAPLPRLDERSFQCKATGHRSWELLDEWVKKWLF
ncbi:tRNA (adenosine(37)-N6)-threonylcarbamoyltransferase complex ATPase subunit type 1 TsaE [Alicyclobacillus sp. SO9]|uniref:tRNA (adenosine(37)-N6)-threonylcarbamoyltransferase complex ATPase subunit type 1 TsaE n=1 Tax=Alicyclobacillus sp. SO9 TaxID=2665646 RepID=UPI0018E7C9A0|nr:tRNA (adenosine(37)-N6)-threonylcarbamoyltransferase complex ATPase subunit type 1 TsaE [Alicyclobacillus sp. SO9]QQE78607.1 tRNA (adenosine(37)-N6)-threonylcarbamoyltransferase complex ATPase subunit type 1 TsaE [Alicyclobacillus sp. SO9]